VGGVLVATRTYVADAVVTCDAAGRVFRPGSVTVEDGQIAAVGPAGSDGERLDGLLMPGLVNCHCHSPMTLFRGAAEGLPLMRFLQEVLWPREARLDDEDVYWGTTLACAELLRNGVTTSCEMYTHEQGILRAVLDAGSRCVLTPGVIELAEWKMTWEQRLADVLAFHDAQTGTHPRVEVGIAAHAYYTLPPEGLRAIAEAARERDALLHVHVAETKEEAAHPAALAELGVFDGRVLAAHSVWLSDDDLRLYREHDVAVAHCPQANAKLASGIARLADMLALAIRVGLGTDSTAANNDLDLWEELRLAPLLAKLQTGDAAAVPAPEALALATRKGAEALGRHDLGALEPGRRADMLLLRLDDVAMTPLLGDRDLVSHLVWSASSRLVESVWVEGEQVVAEGRPLRVDVERARAEVERRARRLAAAV
jgi:5-methylthioadenosine/S-adenosylhomocysteine deaminase